jgi:hypothetical protein
MILPLGKKGLSTPPLNKYNFSWTISVIYVSFNQGREIQFNFKYKEKWEFIIKDQDRNW